VVLTKEMQNWVKRASKGSRDLIEPPFISQERLELETSNLAHRFITMGTNERYAKLG